MKNMYKTLSTAAVASVVVSGVAATPASAAVTDYVVKDQDGNFFEYNKAELEQSFLNSMYEGENDALYQQFKENLEAGGFYSFYDTTGKYVAYEDIEEAYLNNVDGFNLHEYTESEDAPVVTLPGTIDKVLANADQDEVMFKDVLITLEDGEEVTGEIIIDKMNRTYGPEDGDATITGDVWIKSEETGAILLRNVTIEENDGEQGTLTVNTPNASVELNNLDIANKVQVEDVAPGTIIISGNKTNIQELSISDRNGISIQSDGEGNIKSITIDADSEEPVKLKGNIKVPVIVNANVPVEVDADAEVEEIQVSDNVTTAKVSVTGKVKKLELKGATELSFEEDAEVEELEVKTSKVSFAATSKVKENDIDKVVKRADVDEDVELDGPIEDGIKKVKKSPSGGSSSSGNSGSSSDDDDDDDNDSGDTEDPKLTQLNGVDVEGTEFSRDYSELNEDTTFEVSEDSTITVSVEDLQVGEYDVNGDETIMFNDLLFSGDNAEENIDGLLGDLKGLDDDKQESILSMIDFTALTDTLRNSEAKEQIRENLTNLLEIVVNNDNMIATLGIDLFFGLDDAKDEFPEGSDNRSDIKDFSDALVNYADNLETEDETEILNMFKALSPEAKQAVYRNVNFDEIYNLTQSADDDVQSDILENIAEIGNVVKELDGYDRDNIYTVMSEINDEAGIQIEVEIEDEAGNEQTYTITFDE